MRKGAVSGAFFVSMSTQLRQQTYSAAMRPAVRHCATAVPKASWLPLRPGANRKNTACRLERTGLDGNDFSRGDGDQVVAVADPNDKRQVDPTAPPHQGGVTVHVSLQVLDHRLWW